MASQNPTKGPPPCFLAHFCVPAVTAPLGYTSPRTLLSLNPRASPIKQPSSHPITHPPTRSHHQQWTPSRLLNSAAPPAPAPSPHPTRSPPRSTLPPPPKQARAWAWAWAPTTPRATQSKSGPATGRPTASSHELPRACALPLPHPFSSLIHPFPTLTNCLPDHLTTSFSRPCHHFCPLLPRPFVALQADTYPDPVMPIIIASRLRPSTPAPDHQGPPLITRYSSFPLFLFFFVFFLTLYSYRLDPCTLLAVSVSVPSSNPASTFSDCKWAPFARKLTSSVRCVSRALT
ncbi:hypothetical protein B0H11DRAFT_665639 [Mycena galericulata]|nr:hypothetical protein B0H11DRAFT_665639 [Mycena galericulata]